MKISLRGAKKDDEETARGDISATNYLSIIRPTTIYFESNHSLGG